MPTENDPVISIEYWDDTWKSLLGYAKRFLVKDSGILKISTAEILVNNKGGHWTSGATKIPACADIRITADVRGAVDEIFRGYYLRHEGDFSRRKHDLTLKCKSYAIKLLWDTITRPYHQAYLNQGGWTMKDVIEDFLAEPDSGYDTGITLVTDTGDILTEPPVDDFDRETLLDALREIAEEINYDGYIYDSPPNLKLKFKEIGTVQTNPSITLDHPFIFVRPVKDMEEVRNFVLPWGSIEQGYPPSLDRWTEKHDRWANLWTPDTGNTVSTSLACVEGSGSIKITNSLGSPIGATLDISVDPDYAYVDCSTGRFMHIHMFLHQSFQNQLDVLRPTIDLTDDLGSVIRRGPGLLEFKYPGIKSGEWKTWMQGIGPKVEIEASGWDGWTTKHWWYVSGSDFTWKIKKVRIWAGVWVDEAADLYVDCLHFKGGASINPLINPDYYPACPVKDDTSIGLYGRRLRHIEDHEIKTFKQATTAGQRELATLKDPIRKIRAKKGAKTWAHPHEVLALNLPEYDISSEYWRILDLTHEWLSKGNLLRTTFNLVPQTAPVSTTAIQLDEIAGIFRRLTR